MGVKIKCIPTVVVVVVEEEEAEERYIASWLV